MFIVKYEFNDNLNARDAVLKERGPLYESDIGLTRRSYSYYRNSIVCVFF